MLESMRAKWALRGLAKGDRLKAAKKPYAAYTAYMQAARAGSMEAKLRLADMHEKGEGTQMSLPHALAWYQAAAEQGSVAAHHNAGKCLMKMEGLPRGIRAWYVAANEKSPERASELGRIFGMRDKDEDVFALARGHLQVAAEAGHADAAFLLAELLSRGKGGAQSDEEAIRWFTVAAERRNAGAAYGLGEIYRLGKGVEKDDKRALRWLRRAGDLGHAPAQATVAQMLMQRQKPEHEAEVLMRLTAATKQGFAPAHFLLAALHAAEKGAYFDLVKAQNHLYQAAKADHLPAIMRLAEGLSSDRWGQPDPIEAGKWFRKAADAGDKNAQFIVGRMYATGEGVPKVIATAGRWFRRAADNGHAVAQFNLGVLLERGDGVDKDPVEALGRFLEAAKQGLDVAQFKVGLAYLQGSVIERDQALAAKWLECAADQGHAEAATLLAQIYARRETPPPDIQKATVLLEKAIAAGHAPAMTHLGTILLRTREGAAKAIEWYRAAAEAGQIDAEYALAMLYLSGNVVPVDIEKALHWLGRAANHGHVNAMFQLGVLYCAGDKVPRDIQKGSDHYLAAGRAGHVVAKYNYAILVSRKYRIKGNDEIARQFMQEAADAGLPEAKAALEAGAATVAQAT